jgi:hypothetical protein
MVDCGMAARFRIDQTTPGAGTVDRTRTDLIAGEVINLVVPSPVSGATYAWEIVHKYKSSASLTASTGTSTSIGPGGDITPLSAFLVKLTETVGSVSTTRKRLAVVRGNRGVRPLLFGETANPSSSRASRNPDDSTDNETRTGVDGVSGDNSQNWAGWVSAFNELVEIVDTGTGWYNTRVATSALSAVSKDFVQMVPGGSTVVVTTPAAVSGAYFGVQLCGQALGKVVEIRLPDTTLLHTLTVDDEVIWYAYHGAAAQWRVVSYHAPNPDYTARFSPLGTWLSVGADADLVDTSGNGRNLTKGVTISPAGGAEMGLLSTSYPGRYASADAAFRIAGALSYEYLCCPVLNSATFASALACGAGTGGSANNLQYDLFIANVSGASKWQHRQQSGANITVTLTGAIVAYGWQHVCVTRGSTTKFYLNGALVSSAALAPPDGGASGQLFLGGTSGNQASVNVQKGSIWGSELTAAQVLYLAHLRLGKRRYPG